MNQNKQIYGNTHFRNNIQSLATSIFFFCLIDESSKHLRSTRCHRCKDDEEEMQMRDWRHRLLADVNSVGSRHLHGQTGRRLLNHRSQCVIHSQAFIRK